MMNETNFEHYKDELLKAASNNTVSMFYEVETGDKAPSLRKIINWLYQEYVPFTKTEKIILDNTDSKYKWISRDSNGHLFLYECKPDKLNSSYVYSDGGYVYFGEYNHLFESVTFEGGAIQFRE